MDYYTAKLAARIKATNDANRRANELYDLLAPFFQQYVGKPVVTKDNQLLKRIIDKMPEIPPDHWPDRRVWFVCRGYSLDWQVFSRMEYKSERAYQGADHEQVEATVSIGKLEKGVLVSIYPRSERKCDYELAEIVAAREAATDAKKVYDEALAKCHPFGERY